MNASARATSPLSRAAVFVIGGCLVLAWFNRFVQDDAFIIFRYAKNLASGQGLVWNAGERVEGYTTFLWTLIMTLPEIVGVHPVPFAYVTGLIICAATLTLTFLTARAAFPQGNTAALVTTGMLGTNYTFSAYATGGLETQLQACLFVAALYSFARSDLEGRWSIGNAACLSIVLAAALLTRLDSGLLCLVIVPAAAVSIVRHQSARGESVKLLAALLVPCTVVTGGWLAWKLAYYGNVLPNTFYLKAVARPLAGIRYIYLFLLSYWLMPLPFLVALSGTGAADRRSLWLVSTSLVVVWTGYVAMIGGDFMEFRFLVPVLPIAFLLVGWTLFGAIQQRTVRLAIIATIFAGSVHHALTFPTVLNRRGVETVQQLENHLTDPRENWTGIGTRLGEAFGADRDVTIAAFPAGAIGYLSGLPLVDMFGLSDAWVARYGDPGEPRPGHTRRAPVRYLNQRQVNLVIGDPWVKSNDDRWTYTVTDLPRMGLRRTEAKDIPAESSILEIPLDATHHVVVLYLHPNERVEQAIRTRGWRRYPLLRDEAGVTSSAGVLAPTPSR